MDVIDRLAVSSVTFRDEPLSAAAARVRRLGFTALDLVAIRHYCDHFDPLLVDVGEEECRRTRGVLDDAGVTAVSLTGYPANPLARNLNGDDWAEGVDAYVRLAVTLGLETLVLPPGHPAPPADRWRGTVEHALPWQREAARRAQNARLRLAIALQSDSLLRTSAEGEAFLQLLRLPAGLAVDPAHFAAMHEDPADALRALGSAVAFVVLRDTDRYDYNLPPGAGELDYPAILAALDAIGYTGPLVLAIDDVSLPIEEREARLQQGRAYLEGYAQRKAA
jgi:sugar phosphate isomerase/epimerase